MKFELNVSLLDDDSLSIKLSNPNGESAWTIAGVLEKVKWELLYSTQGAVEVETKIEEQK